MSKKYVFLLLHLYIPLYLNGMAKKLKEKGVAAASAPTLSLAASLAAASSSQGLTSAALAQKSPRHKSPRDFPVQGEEIYECEYSDEQLGGKNPTSLNEILACERFYRSQKFRLTPANIPVTLARLLPSSNIFTVKKSKEKKSGEQTFLCLTPEASNQLINQMLGLLVYSIENTAQVSAQN